MGNIDVYRYACGEEVELIRGRHRLRKYSGIYGIPGHITAWDNGFTWTLLKYIFNRSSSGVINLLKFSLSADDPLAEVGEASVLGAGVSRIPLSKYRSGIFGLPEVVYFGEVPEDQISVLDMPRPFRDYRWRLDPEFLRELDGLIESGVMTSDDYSRLKDKAMRRIGLINSR